MWRHSSQAGVQPVETNSIVRTRTATCIALLLTAAAVAFEGDRSPVDSYSVVFYSGRGGNKDIYILHPGEKEPRRLTDDAAQDVCPEQTPEWEVFQAWSPEALTVAREVVDVDHGQVIDSMVRRGVRPDVVAQRPNEVERARPGTDDAQSPV
jgi:hypothetical protein